MSEELAQYREPTIDDLSRKITKLEEKVDMLVRHHDHEQDRKAYEKEMEVYRNSLQNGGVE